MEIASINKNNAFSNSWNALINITSIGIFIIFLSYIRLYVYYRYFNINIIPYISSEISYYLIDMAIPLGPIIIIVIACYFTWNNYIENSQPSSKDGSQPNEKNNESPENNKGIGLLITIVCCAILLCVSIQLIFSGIKSESVAIPGYIDWGAIAGVGLSLLVIFILLFILHKLFVGWQEYQFAPFQKQILRNSLYAILSLTFMSISILKGYISARSFSSNPQTASFTVDNKNIDTADSTVHYINQTDKYIFLYNEKSKKTLVYPIDKISNLSIGITTSSE